MCTGVARPSLLLSPPTYTCTVGAAPCHSHTGQQQPLSRSLQAHGAPTVILGPVGQRPPSRVRLCTHRMDQTFYMYAPLPEKIWTNILERLRPNSLSLDFIHNFIIPT